MNSRLFCPRTVPVSAQYCRSRKQPAWTHHGHEERALSLGEPEVAVVVDAEVVLRHDPEGADGGQRAAVLAVQLVDVVADRDEFAFLAARQVEVPHQALARVVVAVPVVVHTLAAVLPSVTVARVISRIEHGCPPSKALRGVVREGARTVTARGDSGRR